MRMPAEAVSVVNEVAAAEMVKVASSAAVTLLKFRVIALSNGLRGSAPNTYWLRDQAGRFKTINIE
jgi:hypothetical protein